MVAQNVLDRVFSLPLTDPFELLTRLSDRLKQEGIPLSEEHRRSLDGRIDGFDADRAEGMPWDEFEIQLRNKLGRP